MGNCKRHQSKPNETYSTNEITILKLINKPTSLQWSENITIASPYKEYTKENSDKVSHYLVPVLLSKTNSLLMDHWQPLGISWKENYSSIRIKTNETKCN